MGRSMLYATVPPMTALLLLHRFGDAIRELGDEYTAAGRPDLSRELRFVVGQMEAAAGQLSMDAVAAVVTADSGNAETETGPALEMSEMSTAEAAERLGLTRERVCQLLAAGDLTGRKVGRAWLVDVGSLDYLLEARRAA